MNHKLNVYITHFVPPQKNVMGLVKDFVVPRLTEEYLRSWARLIKHKTRGYQPWKLDPMTKIRKAEDRNRLRYLYNVVSSLSRIENAEVKVTIFTNSIEHSNRIAHWQIVETDVKFFPEYSTFNSRNNSPWETSEGRSPWLLTWEHKEQLYQDVKKGTRASVYLYLEDDSLFSDLNFRYWINWKEKLKIFRLLPSFLRTEWSFTNQNESPIGIFENDFILRTNLPSLGIDGVQFVQMPNPYSGLYILDQDQAEEHLLSPAFNEVSSRTLTWWDIGARSTMGDQFVSPPNGFASRSVVPLNAKLSGVPVEARVPHLPNLYLRKRDVPVGLTADCMFI